MKPETEVSEPGISKVGEKASRFVSSLFPESQLTARVIEAALTVHNCLGAGFLEKVYENALALELRAGGITCHQQCPVSVSYRGSVVGEYCADLIVESRVIVELKACTAIDRVHQAQLMNYLRASRIKVGLLLNFGRPKLECKRVVI